MHFGLRLPQPCFPFYLNSLPNNFVIPFFNLISLAGEVKITSVSKCDGEATANNRKGKLIFFYEWVITAEWTAALDDADAAECSGTIEIPNLSEENEPHELDVSDSKDQGWFPQSVCIYGTQLWYGA